MKALFSGTFNPPSLGHLETIKRASSLFEKLYVGIAQNGGKQPALFSLSEREAMLQDLTSAFGNVQVVSFSNLAIDYVKDQGIDVLIRSLRSTADYPYELQMAEANRKLSGIETFFLLAEGSYTNISSSLIREIGRYGRRLHGFVPEAIEEKVFQRLKNSI